ncbi:MAG: CHAT domain-containing protein, partial [Caldilineaceae bacterium]|nr:CHAT domain-containing protein [Caldilineaceae bacterium]
HYAPFSAFYDAQTGKYLAQSYAVTYAPSSTLYKQLLGKRNPDDGHVLVLGNNDDQLPFAREEARTVGESLGTTPLLGTEATESVLYEQANQLDILHVAAAGLYATREPLFGKVTLAGDDQNDGVLEAYEIYSKLDLSNANLVVLAGNSQPDGEPIADGAAIQALTWAFQYAGSPAVLATNWRVDDESVATFFEHFYQHLREKHTTAEALRLAQIEILNNPATASPYYWAAFNLYGDYQGDGQVETIDTAPTNNAAAEGADAGEEKAQDENVGASETATNTAVVTTGVGGITQSNELSNVFVVTEGAEIAGLAKVQEPAASATKANATDTNATGNSSSGAVTVPFGDLTNGVCNNITLPLGLVLVADFFRRNLFRKRKQNEE